MFSTVWRVLFKAPETFSRMVREGGLLGPLVFYLVLGVVCGWVGVGWEQFTASEIDVEQIQSLMAIMGAPPEIVETLAESAETVEVLNRPEVRLAKALILPAVLCVFFFLWSALVHLLLMVFGGAHQPYETTARVAAYAGTPLAILGWTGFSAGGALSVFAVLPFCGGLIGMVWCIVVQIIGLAKTHECSPGITTAAVLLPFFFCCCCGFVVQGVLTFAFTGMP